jgi:multisubunit Na+/H+ antiporter MnhG subunit
MSQTMKRACLWFVALLMLVVACFSALAILQAGSLYERERALSNLRFWGAIMLLSGSTAIACGYLAIRIGKNSCRVP